MGNAALDAIGLRAGGFGQRRVFSRIIHHGGEAFLRIVDDGVVFDELLLFFGEGHGSQTD